MTEPASFPNNKGRPAGSGTTSHARRQRRSEAALQRVTDEYEWIHEEDSADADMHDRLEKGEVETSGWTNNKGRPAGSGTTSHARRQRRSEAALQRVTDEYEWIHEEDSADADMHDRLEKGEVETSGWTNNKGRPAGSGTTSHARRQRRSEAALQRVTDEYEWIHEEDSAVADMHDRLEKGEVETSGWTNNKGRPAGSGTTSHARRQRRSDAALQRVTDEYEWIHEEDSAVADMHDPLEKGEVETSGWTNNKGRPAGSGTTSHARRQRRSDAALQRATDEYEWIHEEDSAVADMHDPLEKGEVETSGWTNNKGRPAGSGTTSHARRQRRSEAALQRVTDEYEWIHEEDSAVADMHDPLEKGEVETSGWTNNKGRPAGSGTTSHARRQRRSDAALQRVTDEYEWIHEEDSADADMHDPLEKCEVETSGWTNNKGRAAGSGTTSHARRQRRSEAALQRVTDEYEWIHEEDSADADMHDPLEKGEVETSGRTNNKGRPAGSGTTSHARRQRRSEAALQRVNHEYECTW